MQLGINSGASVAAVCIVLCNIASAATVDIKQLGAVGDGVADDTAIIQKALDGGNRTVLLPTGTYKISAALKVDSHTTIKADPQAIIRLADRAGTNVGVFLLTNRDLSGGNSDITVEGGIWDGNNEHNHRGREGDPNGYTGTAINFVNVRRLALRNLTVRNPEAFSIRLCEVEDFAVENIRFDHTVIRPNQDGIHLNGFCHRGVIRDLRALTPRTPNDDMVAINADDATDRIINLGMKCGPISDITVENLQADDAYTFVRLLSYRERIENITVSNVSGGCRVYAINLDRWRFPAGGGNIRNVTLRNFTVRKRDGGDLAKWSNKEPLIPIQSAVRNLRIENFRRDPADNLPAPTLVVDNGQQNRLLLEGQTGTLQTNSPGKTMLPAGGFSLLTLDSPIPPFPQSATVRTLRDDGVYQDGAYWTTPLAWLMTTLMRVDPAGAAGAFCDAVEDFQTRKDVNEWVNDNAEKRKVGVRNYCASAAMPLAGLERLRAFLVKSGKPLPPDLAKRVDAAETWLRTEAKRILRGSSRVGKDGVHIFTPDASGGYGAFWVRDWSYSIEGCPEVFTREEIRDGYLFLAAAQREDGCMPDRVRADGQGVYSPGSEAHPLSRHGSVDQSPFMVILCHQHWKLHHDLDPFRRTAAALEKAMRFTPRNPANGLVTITDATLFRPYSFIDNIPLVGDEQFSSVLFWDACQKLVEMFEASGQPDRAAPWRREAGRVRSGMSTLWDERAGVFVAASEKWRQPSVWGSLFAVYAGLATPEQTDRITGYCRKNYDLIVTRGQVRHLPKGTFWGRPEPEFIK